MTKEEIKYASKDYVNYLLDKQEYHNENYTEDDIRQAFEKGAMLANNNPDTSSPWHDASEEPQGNNWHILCQNEMDGYCLESRVFMLNDPWKEFVEEEMIVKWAYIKDLLPKGGDI